MSYQKLSDQAATPPDRNQSRSREEQRSRRKGEQKQTGFHEKYEIEDRNPAGSPPQWESLRQDKAKPEGQEVKAEIRLLALWAEEKCILLVKTVEHFISESI